MRTIECERCRSVMGLVKETQRWALYKCFSCRHIIGQFNKKLTQDELKDATMEMDTCAQFHMDYELKNIKERLGSISSEELNIFLNRNNKPNDMISTAQVQAESKKTPHDWLSAIESYKFQMSQIVDHREESTCVECIGKFGTYRAFFDDCGSRFILQWIISHPSIGQLDKQERDDWMMEISQATTGVELDFNVNKARLRVQYIGIPDDYYLTLEKSVLELESVIPILLSKFGQMRKMEK